MEAMPESLSSVNQTSGNHMLESLKTGASHNCVVLHSSIFYYSHIINSGILDGAGG
jgi:hypothetical protein